MCTGTFPVSTYRSIWGFAVIRFLSIGSFPIRKYKTLWDFVIIRLSFTGLCHLSTYRKFRAYTLGLIEIQDTMPTTPFINENKLKYYQNKNCTNTQTGFNWFQSTLCTWLIRIVSAKERPYIGDLKQSMWPLISILTSWSQCPYKLFGPHHSMK